MSGLSSSSQRSLSARHIGTRFWVQLALAVGSAVLLIGTLAWPDWIEIVFRVDPDHGSGWLEWAIVFAAFALMVTFSVGTRRQWQRASRLAAVGGSGS
jgi:hypothetical protein